MGKKLKLACEIILYAFKRSLIEATWVRQSLMSEKIVKLSIMTFVTAILLVVYPMAAVMGMELLNNKGEVLGFSVKARMGLWLETSKHNPVACTVNLAWSV